MGEKVEKAVNRMQKWSFQNFHWIVLIVVAVTIPDVMNPSKQEPLRYWLSWFCIVSGIVSVISVSLHKRKLARTQAERESDKNDDTQ